MSEYLSSNRGTNQFVEGDSGKIIRRSKSHSSSEVRSAQARAADDGIDYEAPGKVRSLKGYKRPLQGQKPELDSRAHIAAHEEGVLPPVVHRTPQTPQEFEHAWTEAPDREVDNEEGAVLLFLDPFEEPEVDIHLEREYEDDVEFIPGAQGRSAVSLSRNTSDVEDFTYPESTIGLVSEIPLSGIHIPDFTPDEIAWRTEAYTDYAATHEQSE